MRACLNWRALRVSTRAYDAAVGRGLGTVPASVVIGKRANSAVAKATGAAAALREHCATTRVERTALQLRCSRIRQGTDRRVWRSGDKRTELDGDPVPDHAIATAPQWAILYRYRAASMPRRGRSWETFTSVGRLHTVRRLVENILDSCASRRESIWSVTSSSTRPCRAPHFRH